MQLSRLGEIAALGFRQIEMHFPLVTIDTHVVMPNHFHVIIMIEALPVTRRGGVTPPLRKQSSLGQIIAYYKYQTTRSLNMILETPGKKLWQRNHYDRIIRNNDELTRLRHYILENPPRSELDRYHFP
jgi:putative transposase